MAGYNLYSGLDDEAEFLGLWDLDASVLREALALAARDPDLGMRAVMHERLAAALLMSGDADGARQHVEEASHLFASLPQDESVRGKLAEVGILTARLSLLHGQPTQALKRLSAVRSEVQRLGNSDISFEFLCTAGLAAEALGQAGEAHEDLEGAIALAESGLQTITTEHQRLLWSRRCSPAYRGMVHLELSRNPEAAFAWWEWYRGASRRSSLQSRHLFRVSSVYRDLQDAGRLLGQNSIVLSYAVFPEGIAAWTYDGTGVQYRWIAISATMVSRESLRFASLCSDPGSDLGALRQTGLELYEVLINSIKPILQQHTHAMIEADGDLDRIPFDALVDREGNYLADTFTFGYSTGVLYLNGSAPLHNFSADSRALVVADPTAHPELGLLSLPDAELEARTVARDFPRASLLVGGQATRGELERKLATAKVLHFAGHAVVSGNGSALVLYKPPGDGNGPSLFGAVDFNQSSLHRTALVVLSACSTAQGPDGGFNESESLARSLVSSGIPQVIASRWPVESAASSALMKEFYSDLVAGQSTVESLRTSEGHLRAQEDFKHPFYWAAFSLFGKI
jgi:CHAT domain-containing protein